MHAHLDHTYAAALSPSCSPVTNEAILPRLPDPWPHLLSKAALAKDFGYQGAQIDGDQDEEVTQAGLWRLCAHVLPFPEEISPESVLMPMVERPPIDNQVEVAYELPIQEPGRLNVNEGLPNDSQVDGRQ